MGWKRLHCTCNFCFNYLASIVPTHAWLLCVLLKTTPCYNIITLVLNGIHLLTAKTLQAHKAAFKSLPHCHWCPRLLAWHFSLSRLEAACSQLEICYSLHAEAKRVKIESINT